MLELSILELHSYTLKYVFSLQYMEKMLQYGENMEFFIEGGRSRTGKACPPKGGLMSVVVDTLNKGEYG